MRVAICVHTLLCAILIGASAAAEPRLTISCDEPHGFRYGYGPTIEGLQALVSKNRPPPELTRSDDGYSGVNPVFLIDSSKAETLMDRQDITFTDRDDDATVGV